MFISALELFKIGIGPSSSHTMGPMLAANNFLGLIKVYLSKPEALQDFNIQNLSIQCTLKGSLAFTGKGHSTDRAITLGLHGYLASDLAGKDVDALIKQIWQSTEVNLDATEKILSALAAFIFIVGIIWSIIRKLKN